MKRCFQSRIPGTTALVCLCAGVFAQGRPPHLNIRLQPTMTELLFITQHASGGKAEQEIAR
ncbi:MAG: hypothetical protein ACE5IY_15780 [bacterium]